MLGIFKYMVPSSEQPVRAAKVAELVSALLRLAPPGIHVLENRPLGVPSPKVDHVRALLAGIERLAETDLHRAVLAGATWIDGKTVCAESSIGQCHPAREQPAVSDVEPSG